MLPQTTVDAHYGLELSTYMQLISALGLYRDKRIIGIYLLGVSSGFPWVLIGSALTLWLKESGVSRAEIGYAALIFTVFAVNFLWSPLVDRVCLPKIGKVLGHRKSWVLCCQLLIALLSLAMSMSSPEQSPKSLVLVALCIALCAATQDIAIDAYRIDSFAKTERAEISSAAGAATAGWWTGYAGLGFLPLYLSDHNWSWPELYTLMAGFMALICALSLSLPSSKYSYEALPANDEPDYLAAVLSMSRPEKWGITTVTLSPILLSIWALFGSPGIPDTWQSGSAYTPTLIFSGLGLAVLAAFLLSRSVTKASVVTQHSHENKHSRQASSFDYSLARLLDSLGNPIKDFFQRNGFVIALYVLSFIFLFKLGEAFLGRMSIVFYKEIGFSNSEIASYSKMLTWWITVVAAFFAGAINAKFGLIKGLFISGIFMAASNLMFSCIALVGPSIPLYVATIIVDGIATSWSLVAFVAFISALCDHRFSASQYALLASLGALGRTTLSSLSGQLVDWLDGNWALFFFLTALMVIPSLCLLLRIAKLQSEPPREELAEKS